MDGDENRKMAANARETIFMIPRGQAFQIVLNSKRKQNIGRCIVKCNEPFQALTHSAPDRRVDLTFLIGDSSIVTVECFNNAEVLDSDESLFIMDGFNDVCFKTKDEEGQDVIERLLTWNFSAMMSVFGARVSDAEMLFSPSIESLNPYLVPGQEETQQVDTEEAFSLRDHIGEVHWVDDGASIRFDISDSEGNALGMVLFTCDAPFRVAINDTEISDSEITVLLDSPSDYKYFQAHIIGSESIRYVDEHRQIWKTDSEGKLDEYLMGWEIMIPAPTDWDGRGMPQASSEEEEEEDSDIDDDDDFFSTLSQLCSTVDEEEEDGEEECKDGDDEEDIDTDE